MVRCLAPLMLIAISCSDPGTAPPDAGGGADATVGVDATPDAGRPDASPYLDCMGECLTVAEVWCGRLYECEHIEVDDVAQCFDSESARCQMTCTDPTVEQVAACTDAIESQPCGDGLVIPQSCDWAD